MVMVRGSVPIRTGPHPRGSGGLLTACVVGYNTAMQDPDQLIEFNGVAPATRNIGEGSIMEGEQNRGQPLVVALLPAVGFSLAVLAGLAAALAGLGHRGGWWHYRMGFMVLKGPLVSVSRR